MKLILRILPSLFALISINAFAATVRFNMSSNVLIGPNDGIGDNVGVHLFGQGVSIYATGGTLSGWFDGAGVLYFPGDPGLGPTTVLWDGGDIQIGSTFYDFDQYVLNLGDLEAPGITFPTNGKDFTVSFPWTWTLGGTIDTNANCPSSGCDFLFQSQPGTLSFSYIYEPTLGAYLASSASFSTPEPGTLTLLAIGIGALGWRKWRSCLLAHSHSIVAGGLPEMS